MHDRDESIPAPIPRIDPALWEDHEGFRETFLLYFSDPEANETLRRLGKLLFDRALEGDQEPARSESATRSELRAAVAELRFLQGFLGSVGEEHVVSSLDPEDEALSRFAGQQAMALSRIADEIEHALGRHEHSDSHP